MASYDPESVPGIIDERPSTPSLPGPVRSNPPARKPAEEDDAPLGLGDLVGTLDDVMARIPWWLLVAAGVAAGWQIKKRWS